MPTWFTPKPCFNFKFQLLCNYQEIDCVHLTFLTENDPEKQFRLVIIALGAFNKYFWWIIMRFRGFLFYDKVYNVSRGVLHASLDLLSHFDKHSKILCNPLWTFRNQNCPLEVEGSSMNTSLTFSDGSEIIIIIVLTFFEERCWDLWGIDFMKGWMK
jgi:hypothetical protein